MSSSFPLASSSLWNPLPLRILPPRATASAAAALYRPCPSSSSSPNPLELASASPPPVARQVGRSPTPATSQPRHPELQCGDKAATAACSSPPCRPPIYRLPRVLLSTPTSPTLLSDPYRTRNRAPETFFHLSDRIAAALGRAVQPHLQPFPTQTKLSSRSSTLRRARPCPRPASPPTGAPCPIVTRAAVRRQLPSGRLRPSPPLPRVRADAASTGASIPPLAAGPRSPEPRQRRRPAALCCLSRGRRGR